MNTKKVNVGKVRSNRPKVNEALREERRKKVAANLLAGLDYREMAEALGCSTGTVSNDVKIILGRWRAEQVDTADQWMGLQTKRLDRALNAIWGKVEDGDPQAIDRLQNLIKQQGNLRGFERPAELKVKSESNVTHDLSKLTLDELKALKSMVEKVSGNASDSTETE